MTTCSECGTENRLGRRFCGQCGAALSVKCVSCGADNDPGDRFCGECGTPLNTAAPPGGNGSAAPASSPVAQRRLVSVLFADLVGFTSLSEHRDPEEVRELLSGQIESPFLLGQVLLEHAEMLGAAGRDDDAAPLLTEAAEIFRRLRATPWLERAQALGTRVAV